MSLRQYSEFMASPAAGKSLELSNIELFDECGISRLSPEALVLMAEFFKVLSESSRLQIICALKPGSKNVTQIIELTGLGQANVSKHLKVLSQAGIVSRQQKGVSVYYTIANPFVYQLCELVCNSLIIQLEQQSQPLRELASIKKSAVADLKDEPIEQ